MKLLDLYCKAGGASVGYARAGFEVTGIDIKNQKRYPFTFIKAGELVEAIPPVYTEFLGKQVINATL